MHAVVFVTNAEGERVEVAEDGSSVALTSAAIRVRFDRYLDPRSAIRQAYCLRSDQADVEGFEGCSAGVMTLPAYDPGGHTLTIYLASREDKLEPDTVYKLTLLSPRAGTDVGFRAFDGAELETTQVFSFRTAADPGDIEAPPAPEDVASCTDVSNFALGKCRDCHGFGSQSEMPMGLNLDVEGLRGAIGRTAHGTSLGADAAESQERAARFGTNMPLIDPKNPGNSYLFYKILAAAPVAPDGLQEGETERLQTLIVGLPMPADRGEFTADNAQDLSDWITAGAVCD